MCKPSQLASYMLTDLFRRGAHGRQVFVIMHANAMEAVVVGEKDEDSERMLAKYCEAYGKKMKGRRCVPVVLPPGFKADGELRDFKVVRHDKELRIEFNKDCL
jgi:hypothetical protein